MRRNALLRVEFLRDGMWPEAVFERLSPSRRRAHVDAITGAKTPETRQRRIAAAIAKLRG